MNAQVRDALPEGEKNVVIYLPADATVLIKNFAIDAKIVPAVKGEKVLWLGDSITQGNEIIRVSPNSNSEQVIVCYVKLSDAKKIERGMQVSVSLSSAESQTYGHMLARVINIDSYVSSSKGMSYVLGTDNNLASTFQKDGAVVAVTCELYPDPSTTSGYYWSNDRGAKLDVTNGSLVSAKVVVEEVRPITKLFSKLKEIWGD